MTQQTCAMCCDVFTAFTLCTHGQHLFAASLHVFLSPVQLTEPLLLLHSDSLFPTSASLSSSVYICQLSFHPPPMKSIFVMQFHKLDSWKMNWNGKKKKTHQRHGHDFKLLFLTYHHGMPTHPQFCFCWKDTWGGLWTPTSFKLTCQACKNTLFWKEKMSKQ